MRFIHTADLHLDSPMTAHLRAEALTVRRREVNDALRRVLADGVARGGEGVLIVGDLFDSEHVMPYTVDAVLALIREHAPLPFFYIAGNHEGDALSRRTGLPDNLYILGEQRPFVKLPGNITIYGATSAQEVASLPYDPATYNIVLLHAGIGERTDADTLRLSDVAGCPIDYIALGHYHSYAVHCAGERLMAAFCGTPEGRGWDECGDKGYALLDTQSRSVSFIKTASRRLFDLSVDISEAHSDAEVMRRIETELSATGVCSHDLVRVTLTGQVDVGLRRDTGALTARFEGHLFTFELRERCLLRIDREQIAADPTLKGEFLRTVMADTTLTEADKQAVLTCGLRYLAQGGGTR